MSALRKSPIYLAIAVASLWSAKQIVAETGWNDTTLHASIDSVGWSFTHLNGMPRNQFIATAQAGGDVHAQFESIFTGWLKNNGLDLNRDISAKEWTRAYVSEGVTLCAEFVSSEANPSKGEPAAQTMFIRKVNYVGKTPNCAGSESAPIIYSASLLKSTGKIELGNAMFDNVDIRVNEAYRSMLAQAQSAYTNPLTKQPAFDFELDNVVTQAAQADLPTLRYTADKSGFTMVAPGRSFTSYGQVKLNVDVPLSLFFNS